jgi:hypothetical protein
MTHSHRARCEYQRLMFAVLPCGQYAAEDLDGTPVCLDHADLLAQTHSF